MTRQEFQTITDILLRGAMPCDKVGYIADRSEFSKYRLVVVPCGAPWMDKDCRIGKGHGDTDVRYDLGEVKITEWIKTGKYDGQGMPCNLPVMFGTSEVERIGDTTVLHNDIIATAYFFLFRIEETLNPSRDEHGRFPARKSLAFKHGFIHRPIVDEYGEWLRGLLGLPHPAEGISKTYLTHDVDNITLYRSVRGVLGAIKRSLNSFLTPLNHNELAAAWRAHTNSADSDPLFTFPDMMKWDKAVKGAQVIYFLKSDIRSASKFDRPAYGFNDIDVKFLRQLISDNGCQTGWHSSYASADSEALTARDLSAFKSECSAHGLDNLHPWQRHRGHYLRNTNYDVLAALGVTDDFTLAYADMAGFRAGTCLPYHWRDTNLTVHPLTLMDVTLSERKYMNLDHDEAYSYAKSMIEHTRHFGGELTLLWHNNSFRTDDTNGYHRLLYPRLLELIN